MDRTDSRTDMWPAAPRPLTAAVMLSFVVVGLAMTLPFIVVGVALWVSEPLGEPGRDFLSRKRPWRATFGPGTPESLAVERLTPQRVRWSG